MFARSKVARLIVSTAMLTVSLACGLSSQSTVPQPPPAGDLGTPSGSGGFPEATQAAASALPLIIQPTVTTQEPSEETLVKPPPSIPESRLLTLEYPSQIRTGDFNIIRLTLEADTLDNVTPTAEIQAHVVAGQTVQIPNLYDTHDVLAEARLDLAGPDVRPVDLISEPLLPGQSVTFYWSIHPIQSGTYRGTVWLFLRFVDKVSGEESQKPVSAQTVQIEATSFFGLGGNLARTAGGLGSIVGAVLGFPFAGDTLKWLWGRVRRGG